MTIINEVNAMDYQEVIELVKEAGAFVYDEKLRASVNLKGEADFVTAVDLRISQYLKAELSARFPEIGFMSEEEAGEIAENRWILDPIDGTTNLVYGYNMSSVSLALCLGGQIVFGVIHNPFNGDTFVAERGKGVTLNGDKLDKAPDRELKNCLIEFGAGSTRKQYADIAFSVAKEIFKNCLDIRRICSSALAVAYVAAGRLNGYFEKVLKPWDYAAATLMLEECGAVCSDWQGNPVPFDRSSSFVCGTPKAYEFLLEKVREADKLIG